MAKKSPKTKTLKLNLGCGYNKLDGYINVDHDAACSPDIVADLEEILPFADSSVDEIVMFHVLEHLGQDTETYLNIWKELYRVLKDQGVIKITVPHWQHENFHHDPTHVRKVTPVGVDMFSQERNLHTIKTGGNETTLGLQLGIDIGVTEVGFDMMPWFQKEMEGKSRQFIEREIGKYNNVCYQVQIHAKAHKPARGEKKAELPSKKPIKVLVMGLSGAGKTALADAVKAKLATIGHSAHRLNADEVRQKHNDWDFSEEGRIRQSERMRKLADESDADFVICDFIAPLPKQRELFDAHITIWLDTVRECKYADTNEAFVPPTSYDMRVTSQNHEVWVEKVITMLVEKRTRGG